MLNIVSFFNIIVEVCSNICPICQEAFECPMQTRTRLAAVHASEERPIAPTLHFLTPKVYCSLRRSLVAFQNKSDLH